MSIQTLQNTLSAPSNDGLDDALAVARNNYLARRPSSVAAFETSVDYMPGGNTRTVLFHGPVPLRIASGSGCKIVDADNIEYVNMLGEYTAGIFGHNHPVIRAAIDRALDMGVNLSGHNPDEVSLARLVCERFPSIDKVRFTNSGTEANLLAISISRYHTGKQKVMVFDGGYHGGLLYFRGGGMPINAPFDYVVAPYNDIEATQQMLEKFGSDIACVLVEPMQGATGCIPADTAFLSMLREECSRLDSVLIFDEVMTSRLSLAGAQGARGVIPDMTTLGKYIGGGLTFGAFGGREDIMSVFDPRRADVIPHAGTFNNNSLTMAAGVAAMRDVLTEETLSILNQRGEGLRSNLNKIAMGMDLPIQFTGEGSLLAMHATRGTIRSAADLKSNDDRIIELVFLDLLEKGFYIARRGFMALMLPLGDTEYQGFEQAITKVFESRRSVISQ
ncbi:MAG: aminotransferase class III-fold pyridoxal phosphate-dependent enzyme [Pseudomonadota bacterium]